MSDVTIDSFGVLVAGFWSQRRHLTTILRGAGLVGVVLLLLGETACRPELLKVEEVAGNWRVKEGGEYVQFNQDKSYRAAMTSVFDTDSIIETGRFSLMGGSTMTVILHDDRHSQ